MKKILSWAVYGGLFLVPFISFIVLKSTFFPFITGKGFVFRILVEILFGLYAMLAAMAPEFRPKLSWLTKAVGLFVLATFVADLFSANVFKSFWSNYERMEGFVLIFHLALYYLVATGMFRSAKDWYRFFNVSLFASVLMSFYGVLQLAGKITVDQGGVRLDGTFGNASYFAIYLVFNIFLALYFLSQTYRPAWQKWIYGLVAIFETYILYFTATRGSILGLIGGLFLAAIVIVWLEKENKTLRKIAVGSLVGIVVLSLGFVAVRNISFVKKSPVLSRFASLGLGELETEGRYYVWPMAVKGFLERPIFGWGQESFNFVFNKYYNPKMYTQEQWFDRTHDIVLDWMINGGIVGFLAYASMYAAFIYYVWRKKSDLSVTEKSLLTGLLAAYIFNNLFVFDNLVSYILFFSVLGYVHTRSQNGNDSAPVGKFQTRQFSKDTLLYAIAPIVLVVTVAAVYFVNVPAIEENFTLISAISPQPSGNVEDNLALFEKAFSYHSFGDSEVLEQLISADAQVVQSQAPDSTKQDFYDFTKTQVEKKVAETPTDARYLLFAGEFFNQNSQYALAVPYLERAVAASPGKQTMYFELGASYIGEKDYADAFEQFKTAYDLEPDNPDAQIIYAVGAIYTKNNDVLKQLGSQIASTTVISDNRFLQAYAGVGDYQSVIAILNIRLQSDPTNLQDQLSLASAYLQIGQKQKAVDIINQMIKEDPGFQTQGEQYIQQIQNM